MTDVVIVEQPPETVETRSTQTETVEIRSTLTEVVDVTGGGADGGLQLGDIAHVHVQGISADTWTVVHPLAFKPNVTVVDSAGTAVEGGVQYLGPQTLEITFSAPFSGTAYLS